MDNDETKDFHPGERINQTLVAVKKNWFDFIIW